MNTAEILGSRIQKIRLSRGMTQELLAFKIDKSTHYISAIERGIKSPRIVTLINIMDALDITPNELFCDFMNTENSMNNILRYISAMEDRDKDFIIDIIERYYSNIYEKDR